MKTILLGILWALFFLSGFNAIGQLSQYNIGGPGFELATKIKCLSSDGSSIIAGYSYDLVSGTESNCQAILMKVTATGAIAWQKTFGVAGTNNFIKDMIITQDGNIVVVGCVRGMGNMYADNTAAILKYDATTGNLMWQKCFRDAATTAGGEFFFSVAELSDGRLVAVGTHNFTPAGAGSMVCVFQSTGTLIYNEVHEISSGDEYQSVVTAASGTSVYMCGEFVGNYKDGRVVSYTPGTSSGTINWAKNFDYAAAGSMPNNFFTNIYLSGTKLLVLASNINDYSASAGGANSILSLNAADGSGGQVKVIQNSGAPYGNSGAMAVISADHLFLAQSPAAANHDPAVVTAGSTTSSVINEITSLSGSTASAPVQFNSSVVGEHSITDMAAQGGNLLMAGGTTITTGFGNNDIYYIAASSALYSLNHTCDTAHTTINITIPSSTDAAPAVSVYNFTPAYSRVDTGSTNYNIALICGDAATVACTTIDTTYARADTIACSTTGSITISAPAGYSTWLWSTGATTSSISAVNGMTYWVYASTTDCRMLIDTIHVTVIPTPTVNLGNDTSFCMGDSITLSDFLADGSSQLWSTGATVPSITVTTSGTYWIDVTTDGCTGTDTINVTVNPTPQVNIGHDTSICAGAIVPLRSSFTYTSPTYLWSTGSTSPAITASDPGTYWLSVTVAGCKGSDTMHLAVNPMPDLTLGNDTAICPQDSILLHPAEPAGTTYLWSTGSQSPEIEVAAPGTYKLTVTLAGCSASDSIKVSTIFIPAIDLGPDTILCLGDVYNLNAGTTENNYTWSTGATTQNISVTQSDIYWATYKSVCGVVSDTVNVQFGPCDIAIPSAFTPNNDGLNEVIKVVGNLAMYKNFSFSIYNRWGQRIFYTTDIYEGWNGKFNGVPQDIGTYFYMVNYSLEGKSHLMKGDIELIR